MLGRIDGDVTIRGLDDCDAVIVRGIPRGSLEQVIFRVDALHVLAERGVTCINGPRAIERTVDKFLASALLARAGVPTPRTIACERVEDALEAFEELGGDVIVKPLFGSMGAGMTRVDDADVAYRVFHALALERAVYYLQETHEGRDVRAFVVGGRVLAAIERVGSGWRVNLARGAQARATELTAEQERVCLEAAEALGVDYAGVDLLGEYVLELNGIPGWHGLQAATGADVAAALVTHLETKLGQLAPPDDAAVQRRRDERAGRAGGAERAQVLDVAHAAAGEQLEVAEGGVNVGDQADIRYPRRCPTRARSSTIASRRPGRCSRATASSAGRPASCGSGDSRRPSRRSTLRTTAPSGSSASSRSSASGPVSVSVPTITRCAPSSSSARAGSGSLTPASTMTPRLARQRGDGGVVLALAADGVEVGDVELVEPELGAVRARQRQRIAVVAGDHAADRAIAFALAAHGVNRHAVLEIDDSHDPHAGDASNGHRRREHEGRLAAGHGSLRTVSRPFEIWRDREALVRGAARGRRRGRSGGRRGDHDDRRAVRRVPDQARGRRRSCSTRPRPRSAS